MRICGAHFAALHHPFIALAVEHISHGHAAAARRAFGSEGHIGTRLILVKRNRGYRDFQRAGIDAGFGGALLQVFKNTLANGVRVLNILGAGRSKHANQGRGEKKCGFLHKFDYSGEGLQLLRPFVRDSKGLVKPLELEDLNVLLELFEGPIVWLKILKVAICSAEDPERRSEQHFHLGV